MTPHLSYEYSSRRQREKKGVDDKWDGGGRETCSVQNKAFTSDREYYPRFMLISEAEVGDISGQSD